MSDTAMETSLAGKMRGFHFCLRNFVVAFYLNGNGQRTCFLKKEEKEPRKQSLVRGHLEHLRENHGSVCSCRQLGAP